MPLDFDPLLQRIHEAGPGAVLLGAEHLKAEAQRRAPVETGRLVGSADAVGAGLLAEVYFPGPYARYQHYELQLRHEHGQALYLEEPTITQADAVISVVAAALRGAFL